MSVPAAYLGVILVWTTTPLAIKWSSEGSHFLFGVTARLALGSLVCLALVRWRGLRMPLDPQALKGYLAAGVGIWGTMTLSYWGSQFIPSGWVSVIFGLTPLFTGLMATLWLGERLTAVRFGGMMLGVCGLLILYGGGGQFGPQALWGIGAIVLASAAQSGSSVWVKRLSTDLPVLALTAGGVTLAAFLDGALWLASGIGWPETITPRAALCTVYLGVGGSVLGFLLYYYVLKRVEATRVALISLITPVSALLLGRVLNAEPLSARVGWGTAAILGGLLLCQFGDRLRLFRRRPVPGKVPS